MPNGADLRDGLILSIGDGVDTIVFEFDDEDVNDGVQEGHLEITFNSSDEDFQVARNLIAAINSDAAQRVELDIQASAADFSRRLPTSATTSNVVNLLGNSLFVVYSPFFATQPDVDGSELASLISGEYPAD